MNVFSVEIFTFYSGQTFPYVEANLTIGHIFYSRWQEMFGP